MCCNYSRVKCMLGWAEKPHNGCSKLISASAVCLLFPAPSTPPPTRNISLNTKPETLLLGARSTANTYC